MDENTRNLRDELQESLLEPDYAVHIDAHVRAVVAEHVAEMHGPAHAVENDTMADAAESERCYTNAIRTIVWKYTDAGGHVWYEDGMDNSAADVEDATFHSPIPAAEALALIAKWQAAKQPAPASTPTTAPATAEAPERVWVHFYNDGSCIASAKRACFYDSSTDEPAYLRSDISDARVKELEASLKIANDTISDLYTGLHELDEKCEQLLRK